MTTQILRQSWIVRHSPIFYGWVVWFAATIGLSATSPGQSYSISLFIDHYISDFGLDRTTVSGLYGLGTFLAALSLIWVGKQIDRRGNRLMSVIIALLFGIVLLASSLVAGPLTILLSFIALRGLGQGSLGLVSTTAVAQWFQKRRGWVMGLSLVGFAVFQRFYLPWMQGFITAHGWRAAWVFCGVVMLLVILPLLGALLRNRPEDFGLQPDGDPASSDDGAGRLGEDNWSLSEAMRTPIFWAFTFARMLAGAWGTALIFHQVSLFETLGHSAGVAASVYGQGALMTAGFTLVSGWLVDRLRPGQLIAIQMLGLIGATGLMQVMTAGWMLPAYAAVFGVFMGVGAVFDGTVWVTLFGRLHQGAIRGFVAMSMVIGTAIGPITFGLSYDHLGTYAPSLWLGIGLAVIVLTFVMVVGKPVRAAPSST